MAGWSQPKKFTAWSFSRFAQHRKCPAQAKYKHLDKLPEPQHPAAARGEDIGKRTEAYLKKQTAKMPVEITSLKAEFQMLRKQKGLFVEEMWGFDKNWSPVAWNDWNNCWLRVKIDVGFNDIKLNQLDIRDNKSGKYKPEDNDSYMEQLSLYAAAGVAQFPATNRAIVSLQYTDHGIIFPTKGALVYTAKQAKALQKDWTRKAQPMLNDTRFAPRPGDHCRWCPYSKSKGGPCRY